MRQQVWQLLAALCLYSPAGHTLAMDSLANLQVSRSQSVNGQCMVNLQVSRSQIGYLQIRLCNSKVNLGQADAQEVYIYH